jgi:hypothetical protein
MTSADFDLKCWSLLEPSLKVSEIDKHTRLLNGLRQAPAPWTPIDEFKPLRKAGRDDDTTLEVLAKRIFPRWVKEVMVNYVPRSPAAVSAGDKDFVNVVILPERVPDGAWVKSWLPTFLSAFEPGIILGRNMESLMRHRDEMRARKSSASVFPTITEKLLSEYSVSVIPELFWASRPTCHDCLGFSPEELVTKLQSRGVTASLLHDGLLVEGTDHYLTTDEAYAVQGRLTDVFRDIVPPSMRSASSPP